MATHVFGAVFTKNVSSETITTDEITVTGPLSLATAVADAGSTKKTIVYSSDLTLAGDLVIPAYIELLPLNGAVINHGAYTISYAGSTVRWPIAQIFSGTGAVNLTGQAGPTIYAEWLGAKADGTTICTSALQRTLNCAIQNGHILQSLAGTYLIKPKTEGIIYLSNFTADYQGLDWRGSGRGKTIIKRADGEVTSRYDTAFYCWFTQTTYKVGSFTITDMTFDGNARGQVAPATPYAYETSHILRFQGDAGSPTMDALTLERVEFKDKTACGLAVGPCTVDLRSLVLRDIQSTDHALAVQTSWGQKGCIEAAIDCENAVYEAVNCLYSQIEPTSGMGGPNRVRRYKISNSKIDTFEFTDTGYTLNGGKSYTYIDANGLYSKDKFLARGVHFRGSNSTLKHSSEHYNMSMDLTNCTILLPYDAGTKVVTSLYINTPAAFVSAGIYPNATFTDCQILIDADTVDAAATGHGVRSNAIASYNARIKMTGCEFDSRLYGVVDAVNQGGFWEFNHCKLAGHTIAVSAGTTSTNVSSVVLNNCDFSAVTGMKLKVTHAAEGYALKIYGTYLASEWSQSYGTSLANGGSYIARPTLIGSGAPVSGTWFVRDRIVHSAPAAGGTEGWVCTTAGQAVKGAWTTATAYVTGDYVSNASKLYVAASSGTSGATAPTHTSGTVTDGAVTWTYVSAHTAVVFKTYGAIAA